MKKCPVCGTKYANDKEFCELDRALLVDCPEETEKRKEESAVEPFNKKRLLIACIYACGFIGLIIVLYYWLGGGFSR